MWRLAIVCSLIVTLFFIAMPVAKPLADSNFGNEAAARRAATQPFRYLASGGQTDVFVSEDGLFVLKLFKNQPKKWIPLPVYHKKKLKKLQRDIDGYRLAATTIPEESGLIFCHLTKTPFGKITLYPQKGAARSIDLGSVEFILQKRAEPFDQYFAQHPSKEALASMKKLLETLAEKNLDDHDPRLHKNIGMLEGKAILIDPGKLTAAPHTEAKFPPKFCNWIKNNYPEFEVE
jgi:hypothetical protein